jgi:transcriptional regulator with XRE-family HTH domain
MLEKPQSFVSKYENGDRSLEISEVYLICKELNKSLSDFEEILESLIQESI